MQKKIHLVSFDVPFPPNYGGVIDVFYKLKALKDLGVEVVLHTFEYGRGEQKELEKYCSEVFYYERKSSQRSLVSKMPFIVKSRENRLLEERLKKSKDPILFEGLHTTHVLKHSALSAVKTIVRTHNIEHDYYLGLAKSEKKFWKKSFFRMEAIKLKKYESVLKNVNHVLSISPAEQGYLEKNYGEKTIYVPVFSDVTFTTLLPEKNMVLWHGDLRVSDNVKSALFAIDVVKNTPYHLVIASSHKNSEIYRLAENLDNVVVDRLKGKEDLDILLSKAKVNMLFTYQPTGIKLKLLNALVKSRHVLTNKMMVNKTGLEGLCVVSKSKKDTRVQLDILMNLPFSDKEREQRKDLLKSFEAKGNAQKIMNLLD